MPTGGLHACARTGCVNTQCLNVTEERIASICACACVRTCVHTYAFLNWTPIKPYLSLLSFDSCISLRNLVHALPYRPVNMLR